MNEYIKMIENEENEENNDCMICFENCNKENENICFCNKCNNKFHLSCYKNWIKKCKETSNNMRFKCVYCQNYKTIYKKKQFCCMYYSVKIS